MTKLPGIGTKPLFVIDGLNPVEVSIVAHYKDKAVFIYLTKDKFERVDMATAPCFRNQK
ncbi:hypothetical protein B2_gp57 [Shigella phage B2]|nr:hypothetical protein B2_gp57 [Shigella phage B2]